jgi:hypothetical protein
LGPDFLTIHKLVYYIPVNFLRPQFGIPIWDLNLRFSFETPILDPDFGPRFGTPPFWTLILDLDLGHPNLGPRFGTLIWDPAFGTLIWNSDLGPPICDPHFGP